MGKMVKSETLKGCMDENWRILLGYIPTFHVLVHEWLFFIMKVKEDELLVSFDIVSLYTNIPVDEAVDIIKSITDTQTANLVRICLKSTYFSYKGNIYE